MSYMLGKSVYITDDNKIKEADTPIMDVTQLPDDCYKITDANWESINLEADKLYPVRMVEYYKKSKGFKTVDMPTLDFASFFNQVADQFGYGEYAVNAITHQPFLFDEADSSGHSDELLIRTEVTCNVKLMEDDFEIDNIHRVEPFVFAPDIPAVIDMEQWKKMTHMMEDKEQEKFINETADQMEVKLSELFMNKSMIELAHVWDKINVGKQRSYD